MVDTDSSNSSRDKILDVGAQLFLEHGYADTTLRKIGAEVGMRAASIYYHFPSKDDLLTEILAQGIAAISSAFDEAIDGTQGEAAFRAAVLGHLNALFAGGPYTATHVTVFRRAPHTVRKTIVPLRDAYEERWDRLLRSLVSDGVIRTELDLGLVRLTLLGSMNSTLEWFRSGGGLTIDDLADVITEQFWSGLAA